MQFRLLGPLEIAHDGRSPVIARPRQRAVLAYLLLSANRLVSTEALIDAVWGEAIPSTARTQIHADMSAIRRAFRVVDAPDVIISERIGYRIMVEPGQLDLDGFTDLVDRARAALAAGYAEGAAGSLGRALALWRGPALADVAADYVESARAGLEERRLAAHEDLADAQLQVGLPADVISGLTPVVRRHPLRERACGLLMVALYRAGRQADALGVARDLRRALADEHGLDPGPRIRDLEARILRADPTLEGPEPGGSGRAAGRPVPAQLPPTVADFIGRDDLLAQMDAVADRHDRRRAATVIALTGPAGVGKTALALRWAHAVRDRFPDGQLHVNLHGYSPAGAQTTLGALGQLLRALGVRPDRVPDDVDEASAVYRTLLADRRTLVVLDNCADSEHVRPLLPGHRGCVTVVTSRDSLSGLVARDGVTRLSVDVLPPGDSGALLTRIVGEERTAAEPAAVHALAQLCGHLPLALRVAATRLADRPTHTIREDVDQLREGNRLSDLDIDGDRQASVEAALESSYLALADDTRRLFRLLSLVPGTDVAPLTAAAVAGVTLSRTSSGLGRLAAVHLIDTVGPHRYAFHDLIRLYAQGRARAEERDDDRAAAVTRLLAFYLSTATAAVSALYPQMLRLPPSPHAGAVESASFDDLAAASAWLDSERPNLVAAVLHAAEEGPRELAWSLADALRGYFFATMYTVDWAAVARAGLAAAELGGDLAGQAAAHMSLAGLHWRQGRHDDALRHHTAALRLAAAVGWAEAEAATLGNLGTVYAERGQFDAAVDHIGRALAINQRLGWLQGQAVNHLNLGLVNRVAGRFDVASEHYRLARPLYRELKSVSGEAICTTNLGELLLAQGQPEMAQGLLDEALALHRSVGDRANEAETLRCLAAVRRDLGRLAEALRTGEKAVALVREAGHPRFEIEAVATVASIRYAMGDYDRATGDWLQALRLARQADNRFIEVEVMLGLAVALWKLDFADQAGTYVDEALDRARRYGYPVLVERALAIQADLRTRHG